MKDIAILGLGYVGLPLALRYSELGRNVIAIDVNESKVDALKAGNSYIKHISNESIRDAHNITYYSDFSKVENCDAIIICVPTPLTKFREPDLTYVENTITNILPHLKHGQTLSLESTTYPGTTNELIAPRLSEHGFILGQDFYLIYSPEREDPANPKFKTANIPKVVGGYTENCLQKGIELYSDVVNTVVPVSSTKTAELTKLLENIHRAVNIGLMNEMKVVADKMGIDIYEVIDAAATKPFGFTPYYPGPGLGGHCIPIDPFYLTWKAKEYELNTKFIELAGEINTAMPNYVIDKVVEALNLKNKSISNSKVLILGLAYKKNVDDLRESPSISLIKKLLSRNALVSYSDPFIDNYSIEDSRFNKQSVVINKENIQKYDCVILATNHDDVDYDLIQKNSSMIVDTRGTYRDLSQTNIIRA